MVKFKKCPKCGYYPQPGDRYVFERCNSCGLNYSSYYKRRRGINTFIFWHVVLLLFSLFSVEINGGWEELIGAIKSKHTDFSQTKGMITTSEKVKVYGRYGHFHYEWKIYYGFMVEDILYVSNFVTFHSKRIKVDELLNKYPEGKEVVVYYDGSDPEFSALEPNIVGYDQLHRPVVFLSIGIVSLWLIAFIKLKKYKISRLRSLNKD